MRRKHLNTASWLWLLGLFGLCGLHRIYLGKKATGAVWVLTFGLFGLGQVYDMFTLRVQVKDINTLSRGKVKFASPIESPPLFCAYCDVRRSGPKCHNCGAKETRA